MSLLFLAAIGNWIRKFRTFKHIFQTWIYGFILYFQFWWNILIFLYRFIQIQMNFAFGSQHVRRGWILRSAGVSTNGPGRFLPDRALDVLDDAATLASAEVRWGIGALGFMKVYWLITIQTLQKKSDLMLIEREQFHSWCMNFGWFDSGSYTQTTISSSRNVSQDMTWDVKSTNAAWESSTSLGHDYFVSPSLKIHETYLDGSASISKKLIFQLLFSSSMTFFFVLDKWSLYDIQYSCG